MRARLMASLSHVAHSEREKYKAGRARRQGDAEQRQSLVIKQVAR